MYSVQVCMFRSDRCIRFRCVYVGVAGVLGTGVYIL